MGGSHDECLLTQIFALRKKGNVILITNRHIAQRNVYFQSLGITIVDFEDYPTPRKILGLLKKHKAEKTIFNTAQGKFVRNISILGLFSKIEFIGIIHTKRMFFESFTQKIINWKIKKYLVLSEFILNEIQAKKNRKIDYFYPIRFPKSEPKNLPQKRRRIAVIGGVENRRKDLNGFLEIAQKNQEIDFYFLGRTESEKVQFFLSELESKNLSNVHWYSEFLEQKVFDEILQTCELILPLIHPHTESAQQYFSNQIPGAMTISFAYKIPMLVHEYYSNLVDLNPASFYYKLDSFCVPSEEEVIAKKEAIKNEERYKLQFQEERYSKFVLGES